MMGEPVEQGAGEPFRAEYRSPFIEWQVACDQRGATFIALAEHLEEQFGADSRERHVAQLVDDLPLCPCHCPFPVAQSDLQTGNGSVVTRTSSSVGVVRLSRS